MADTPGSDAIRVAGLRKSFHVKGATVAALTGIDLAVTPGEIFGLLGPNGAGKPNLGNWQFFLPARKDPLAGRNGSGVALPRDPIVNEGCP